MKLPIVFRIEAQAEFDAAFDWYEQQQAGLGVDFLTCVIEVLERVESLPQAYEIVFEDIRRAVTRKFPYLILYRVEPTRIVVMAVFHTKRDPQVWQNRI
ncbi:MAG: type II toxin-antitoxin system RelE/ParE family toxin [Oculatellaceae cyanobacterium Prado106]|jgi:plasmid stabilization system protein ParE|nr:type II toxin-antitoxin system RelE/ParE family toxin [Oculatellaceae cyanobacterium Prado106]